MTPHACLPDAKPAPLGLPYERGPALLASLGTLRAASLAFSEQL